jgi:signal transduction histidine kinase
VTRGASRSRSPTPGLLVGLILTLGAVVAYSLYINRQLDGLRVLQSDLVERNRKDSLQLLRIQNNLNQLGLAMRDMLDDDHTYPLVAWSSQFARIRGDLDQALASQAELAVATRPAADRDRLTDSLTQFWDAVDRTFALAADGGEEAARAQVSMSLQARQAALSTAVARLLIENNEIEEQAAQRVQGIYDQVQRQVYWFLTATLVAIAATGLYLIRANRRLFAELASLSDGRRELAQQLIATRESTLRHLSRELHDEVGQILTAIGSMLGRAQKQTPAESPLRADLREIGEMAQGTLNNVRSLSQTLHPSILEELGLDSTFDWYLGTVEKQLSLVVSYQRSGRSVPIDGTIGIHVYRVLQEALSNVSRHSGADRVWVRLHYSATGLELEVEDHGSGLAARTGRRGLGLVAMRERAELVGGTIEFARPAEGGTIVRLRVPLEEPDGQGEEAPSPSSRDTHDG